LTIEKIESKISCIENELDILKDKLFKSTPQRPLIDDSIQYNSNKKELAHQYTYYCVYCGEKVRFKSKRHKCGQIQDWNFKNEDVHICK